MKDATYCKECKIRFSGSKCPICGNYLPAKEILGRFIVFDTQNSVLAKELDITMKGDYAIKTR